MSIYINYIPESACTYYYAVTDSVGSHEGAYMQNFRGFYIYPRGYSPTTIIDWNNWMSLAGIDGVYPFIFYVDIGIGTADPYGTYLPGIWTEAGWNVSSKSTFKTDLVTFVTNNYLGKILINPNPQLNYPTTICDFTPGVNLIIQWGESFCSAVVYPGNNPNAEEVI